MVRVLQLLDHDAEFESRRGSEGLSRTLGADFEVQTRTIGLGGNYRDLATAAAMLRRERAPFDLVHTWGGRALTAAALGTKRPIVFSPLPETRLKTIQWLRAVMSYRDVQVIAPTMTLRRRLVERGVPIDRCHLIRAGVEFARVRGRRDLELRRQLGFADDDRVYLAAGESTRAASHPHAVWATGILNVVDRRQKILLWGAGPLADQAEGLAHRLGQREMIRVAEKQFRRKVEYEELLPAADAILVPARGPIATLPIAMSMAAALPIVAGVTYTVSELLEDRHTALMTPTAKPRQMAQRMLDLQNDSTLQWQISDMARTEAYEFFSFTRFVNQFRNVYRQVAAGDKVEVPEDAPGAGLRFHGRA